MRIALVVHTLFSRFRIAEAEVCSLVVVARCVCPSDLIAVLSSGAYGLSMSPAAFLGHPLCKEVVV